MAIDKNTIKNWFRTGLKPTQSQFWAWMDSYWHKEELIPTNKIAGLEAALNSKASNDELATKVDKFDGKSLLLDSEIERLLTLQNQDLSLKADLVDGLVPASQLPSYVNISNADLTFAANRNHNLGSNKLTFTNGRFEVPTLEMQVTTANSIINKIWNEGVQLWFTNSLGVNRSILLNGDIVDATATQRGLVSTMNQIFSGNKTFRGHFRIESPVSTDAPEAFTVVNSSNVVLLSVNSNAGVTMGNFGFSSVNQQMTFGGVAIFERSGISTIYGSTSSSIVVFRTSTLNFTMRDGRARFGGTSGGATDSTALLELQSTNTGFLLPRMTQAQRLAITYLGGAPPAIGLQVYQTDGVEGVYIHKSTGWQFAY